jgi:hypothetical protein
MFVHDRFVFLQMRKTGSTFLIDALERELPGGRTLSDDKHASWAKIPPEAAGRPVLVYTRNPWDWYVSWHHFNLAHGGMANGFWRTLSAQGTRDFTETVSRAIRVSNAIMGADLYSTLYRNLVGDGLDSQLLTVGRYESLCEDLERFLAAAGVELEEGGIARIRAGEPINASEHAPYRDYYDEELRDLIGDSCRPLLERFGYEF